MNCLKDEMTSSLVIINIVGIIKKIDGFKKINHIRTTHTNNLSANRSRRAPKEVSLFVFLATYPSK